MPPLLSRLAHHCTRRLSSTVLTTCRRDEGSAAVVCPRLPSEPGSRSRKWIGDLDARSLEIRAVASGHDEAVNQGGRCNEAVLDGHGPARYTKAREQRRPSQTRFRLPRQTVESLNTRCEPSLKPGPSLSLREKENAEPNLSENNRIDGKIRFVSLGATR